MVQPPPLLQERPVSVLPREGESAVGEAEQVLLLVINQGGISPPHFAELQLQIVEELGVHPALLRLGAAWRPGMVHARRSGSDGLISSARGASQVCSMLAVIISSLSCTHDCSK